jgi:FixJ family two-component response regulator
MPNMIGPDLAILLKVQRPGMHVILMSGYPDGALLVLNYGWQFIRKPFVPKALLERIESVLKSTTAESGTDYFDTGVEETAAK